MSEVIIFIAIILFIMGIWIWWAISKYQTPEQKMNLHNKLVILDELQNSIIRDKQSVEVWQMTAWSYQGRPDGLEIGILVKELYKDGLIAKLKVGNTPEGWTITQQGIDFLVKYNSALLQ
jgi:hypothetical protein